jgi:hypothetical protein
LRGEKKNSLSSLWSVATTIPVPISLTLCCAVLWAVDRERKREIGSERESGREMGFQPSRGWVFSLQPEEGWSTADEEAFEFCRMVVYTLCALSVLDFIVSIFSVERRGKQKR